ncbi:hypothetical protein CLU97_0113 [Chryseobacterium sp. 7]|uniref:hypothetical protein n=1 Tax=Chryseobacterium sp. 7 TaxID=2035214 RepID=UPI000F23642D|nr:hypothetical protein [Chryseobacterium sp. 7]RLJ30727.1 hypothetical protein CLU97_0113 [Chryseobacterium sp. 7]
MFEIESISSNSLEDFITASFCYNILIIEDAVFSLNFKTYISSGKTMLLIGPNQIFSWISSVSQVIDIVKFDGEIYNSYFNERCTLLQGILSDDKFYMINNQCIMEEVIHIIDRMKSFHIGKSETYDIGQLYLRLIISFIFNDGTAEVINCKYSDRKSVICFQNLVESFFSENKQVSFYAAKFGMPI